MLNHSHGENFFPCIQSIIPCCNFQLSLVLPLCASEFVLLFFMTPLQENGSWILLSLLLWPLCPSVFSHGGIHGLLRCQVFLALYQTLRNAIHSAVRFQAVHPNPLKRMVQPVFNHLVVHLSSPHLPSSGYNDVRLFCPFCAYKRFS